MNSNDGKIKNIKKLIGQMNKKSDFVEVVADHFGMSYFSVMNHWFQRKWSIPEANQDKVIELAQNYLFNEAEVKRKILLETGYEFSKN